MECPNCSERLWKKLIYTVVYNKGIDIWVIFCGNCGYVEIEENN